MFKLTRNAVLIASLLSGLIFTSSALAVTSPNSRQSASAKLTDTKLKMCQARENGIKQRSTRLAQLVTTMEETFDKIAARVKDYYNSKVVPAGKTVSNYPSLVADIQTKKDAVAAALTKAQNDASTFSCSNDDPKGQITQFRVDMQAVKTALKDYRTSVKNLIVAVRSLTGETNRSGESSLSGEDK